MEVKFHSKRQEERFSVFTKPEHNTEMRFSRVRNQNSFGEIVIESFQKCNSRWYGYLTVLGKRGGEKVLHGWYVTGDTKENLTLVRR